MSPDLSTRLNAILVDLERTVAQVEALIEAIDEAEDAAADAETGQTKQQLADMGWPMTGDPEPYS